MKMITVLVCTGVLLISGCGANFTPEQLNKALSVCGKNDGIEYISINTFNDEGYKITEIKCKDGAEFTFYDL